MAQKQSSDSTPGDLFQGGAPAAYEKPRRVLTVSQITQNIKLILESSFGYVWVEGEVSGVSKIATGTVFFNLKDNASLLKCVIFHSVAGAIKFELKDGMQLVCLGRISVWEKDGRYQLYVQEAEPKGIGSLQLALEQLKAKLEKEGLFDPAHKRPLPHLPGRIGVVTSLQGAALKDILKVLDRRFKDVHIIISPARVQGEGAREEIVQAITDLNRFNQGAKPDERIEVMIVGRGGGSIEDLWSFNEEIVARAIYQSKIPVISAVGHERDWTIADLVADVRAPTPSVAAELVIPKKEDLTEQVHNLSQDLRRCLEDVALDYQEKLDHNVHRLSLAGEHALELTRGRLDALVKKLGLLNPAVLIRNNLEKIIDVAHTMHVALSHYLALRQAAFRGAIEKLRGLSPLNILGRGYSITFNSQGSAVTDAAAVKAGEVLQTRLHKGEITSQVIENK
jgi:exodeoxyribonuclease VII large subunit